MVSAEFEGFYNSDKYQNIFELFSAEMKAALPIVQTADFLKGLKSQVGKIEKRKLIKYQNGTYAFYKKIY